MVFRHNSNVDVLHMQNLESFKVERRSFKINSTKGSSVIDGRVLIKAMVRKNLGKKFAILSYHMKFNQSKPQLNKIN